MGNTPFTAPARPNGAAGRAAPRESARSVVLSRLASSRYALMAAGLVAVFALLAGVDPLAGVLGYLTVIAGTALGPRRSRAQRLAERAASLRAVPRSGAPSATAVVDALPDPAFMLDPVLAITHQNAAATRVFGASAERMGARLKFRSPEIRDCLERVVRDRDAATVEAFNPPGTERWFSVRATPMREASGVGKGNRASARGHVLLLFREETERLREERLRADFVANASHELRTPLASLTGFIETLQGPARDDAAARTRFLAIMAEQAARMGRLVSDLTSLSRLERRAHLEPSDAVDLAAVLRHVRDAALPLAEESGVDLTLAVEASAIVTGERDELIQVVENIVENALRYGAGGGRVVMGLDVADDAAEVWVRDHGPGIPPEHLPRLTERFYRVDVESSRAAKGTGLGLAIVKHILARHGARLRVQSEVGKGARFSFALPLRDEAGKNSVSDQRIRVS